MQHPILNAQVLRRQPEVEMRLVFAVTDVAEARQAKREKDAPFGIMQISYTN